MSTLYWIMICCSCFALGLLGGFQLFRYLASRAIMTALKNFAIDLQKKDGFTLVEVLICLGIISVMVLLIVGAVTIIFIRH